MKFAIHPGSLLLWQEAGSSGDSALLGVVVRVRPSFKTFFFNIFGGVGQLCGVDFLHPSVEDVVG